MWLSFNQLAMGNKVNNRNHQPAQGFVRAVAELRIVIL